MQRVAQSSLSLTSLRMKVQDSLIRSRKPCLICLLVVSRASFLLFPPSPLSYLLIQQMSALLRAQKWGNKTSRGMIDIFKNYINIELHVMLSIM